MSSDILASGHHLLVCQKEFLKNAIELNLGNDVNPTKTYCCICCSTSASVFSSIVAAQSDSFKGGIRPFDKDSVRASSLVLCLSAHHMISIMVVLLRLKQPSFS